MNKTQEQKLAEYKIEVPAGTDSKIIDLLIAQHEEKLKLEKSNAALNKTVQDSAESFKELESKLEEAESRAVNRHFGGFTHNKKAYIITMKQARMVDAEKRTSKVITAEDLKGNKGLQAQLIKIGSGMVKLKSDWEAELKAKQGKKAAKGAASK